MLQSTWLGEMPNITVQTTGRCVICGDTVCSPDATLTERIIDCKTGYECGTCRGLLQATWVCLECLTGTGNNANAEFVETSGESPDAAVSWSCPECEETEVVEIKRKRLC